MTVTKGFIQGAATTALDTRKAAAAEVVTDASGNPRLGVLGDFPSIVTSDASTAPMRVAVAKAGLVTQRVAGDGVARWTNDGSVFVTVTKPGSNSWYVVVWAKHNDDDNGDANNLPEIGTTTGSAAASPSVPSIPAGATELARVLIPSTATSTQSGGVVITNTYQMTAMSGGVVPVRNGTELAAFSAQDGQLAYQIDIDALVIRRDGAWTGASFKRNYMVPIADGDRPNLAAMASQALPALPFANRATIKLIGVIGFSATANAEFGANITTTAGTLTNTQSNEQVFCASAAQWYPYSNIAYVDRAANQAATLDFTFSAVGGANGHFKGQAEITIYGPGEY